MIHVKIILMHPRITGPAFFIGSGGDGGDLISFGSGQPDLAPPPGAYAALRAFEGHRYGLVKGEKLLREKLAEKNPGTDTEKYVICNGGSEAIDLALRAISVPGGRVLLPKPYYYSYPHNVRLAGMVPDYYELVDGKIDIENFKKIVHGARAVMVNSPSNPTGTVQDVAVLRELERVCDELGIYVISDEVYKDLMYDRENYRLHGRRVITIDSFSKTYAMCGMRVGTLYCDDAALVEAVVEMKTHTAMNTSLPAQAMALAALNTPDSYIVGNVALWKERRDLMYAGMRDLGLTLSRPEGAFYVLPKFRDSGSVVATLYHTYKMITYDGAWFGAPDHVRFSYALTPEKIAEGLTRLKKFMENEYRTF